MSVLEVLVHDAEADPRLWGLCAGYEQDEWRADALSASLMNHLPSFALRYTERQQFSDVTAMELIRRAAKVVYQSDKDRHRGEFGELILHSVLTDFVESEPAICKLFFKDAANDTVKGFDAVHVVPVGDELELWLGEVKFYAQLDEAIRDVAEELAKHTQRDYLRSEFLAITNKIDDTWPHAPLLRRLLHEDTSLDEVFARLRIPVLLTYESRTVARHTSRADPYTEEFTSEIQDAHSKFVARHSGIDVTVDLFLMPLCSKRQLVANLHRRLRATQRI